MFELFKIGFLSVSFLDLLDIFIVAVIIFKLYSVIKGTIASQILIGLLIVLLLSFSSQALNLKALSWMLKFITDIWIITFIILFQPEIRRVLVLLARSPILKLQTRQGNLETINTIVDATFELSQHQHGALMIIVKSSGIKSFVETGKALDAKLTKELLTSIFYPRAPLHDGAVVIKNDIIEAAQCTLPLTQSTSVAGEKLGMRHRAGIGISEQADVLSVIVSEETGAISVAENGVLTRGLSREALRKKLSQALREQETVPRWKMIFQNPFKNN